uniref:Hint domain-containing protein n=1 Tax=Helicotheca tamesis TaxID=374047 RepID=A0A7S2HB31_9STRA|mmetsp:Transcript_16704/g.22884  ORF Transcript_16704/g.22884 Transcript_16704/m.22884 type:complete len:473 (+) Transcript_16704:164-1582(+)|eukprot:CAMPEP_0185726142 /NCGR_PEP_ID=MMETSP1171-20130828/2202_1 /TAXON_ID=374046 /ORGANISM="Helicotheca tamensis, Strain CCMP826" /LENGTH=472 /DNA_ID=CAMNT_0028394431 /DNA_START=140 /DNA_END=1558 /DNA_ORIENTATION=+
MPRTCRECGGVIQPNQLYCRRCGALPEENEEATPSALFDDVSTPIAVPVGTNDKSKDPNLVAVPTASAVLCDDKDLEAQFNLNKVGELNEGNNPEEKEPASTSMASHFCCFNRRFCGFLICLFILGVIALFIAWLACFGKCTGGTSSGSSYAGVGGAGTGGGGFGGGAGCFPGDSLVEIKRPGDGAERSRFIHVKDVQLNDEVRSGLGFSTVYAFGTKTPGDDSPSVQMLQLRTEMGHALETTKNHLVYAGKEPNQNKVVLAQDVMIGDLVRTFEGPMGNDVASPIQRASRVVAINNITKGEGIYHPLTNDGNIVVNGVLASAHAVDGVVPKVEVWGVELIGIQSFQQLLYSPLRVLCHISPEEFCSELHHDLEDGSHLYLNVMEPLLRFLFPKTSWVDQVHNQEEEVNFLERSPYFTLRIFFLVFLLFSSVIESILSHLDLVLSLVTVPLTIAAMSRKKTVCIYKNKIKTE